MNVVLELIPKGISACRKFINWLRYRKKKIVISVPECVKQDICKYISQFKRVEMIDIESSALRHIDDPEVRKRVENEISHNRNTMLVVLKKIASFDFDFFAPMVDKVVYITSDPDKTLVLSGRKFLFQPSLRFRTSNEGVDFDHYIKDLEEIKGKKLMFNSSEDILDELVRLFEVRK
jgi:hypothetical protein